MKKLINKDKIYIVEKENTLLEYLYLINNTETKKNTKNYLIHFQVYVNGRIVTQYNEPLRKGDKVEIKKSQKFNKVKDRRLNIVYEDNNMIVVNKPSGLLSVSTDREKDKTMFRIVSDYIKQKNSKNKVFIVHRLDKDTSGILIFAKKEEVKDYLQNNWDKIVQKREYYAVVEGKVENDQDTIRSYLVENDNLQVYSTKNEEEGKLAITKYKKIKIVNNMTYLAISIETGRKNQIRVHMMEMGHPIVGDEKYKAQSNKFKRLALHASRIVIRDLDSKDTLEFIADIPTVLK